MDLRDLLLALLRGVLLGNCCFSCGLVGRLGRLGRSLFRLEAAPRLLVGMDIGVAEALSRLLLDWDSHRDCRGVATALSRDTEAGVFLVGRGGDLERQRSNRFCLGNDLEDT